MHIHKIQVKNFRLLSDVCLSLDQHATTIVGRNNSGKTSLTELFKRILNGKSPTFLFEDFSQTAHRQFWRAYCQKTAGAAAESVRTELPAIELMLWIQYDAADTTLGALSDLIVDLDPDCSEALLHYRYQLQDGALDEFFDGIIVKAEASEHNQLEALCRELKSRIPARYVSVLKAVDPGDDSNSTNVEWAQLRRLLLGGFINAQRGLDDVTHKEKDVLGKILTALFATARASSDGSQDNEIAKQLTTAVKSIQQNIDNEFSIQLTKLLPALKRFGYPGLSDPELRTETTLEVERLLSDHTRINYAGVNGISLPESYNGLGARNLIFILLRLLEFYKGFLGEPATPRIQLVFIEEPEVHLHPQMQEVFIEQLSRIATVFAHEFSDGTAWPVQFVVTTHSSHVANRAEFHAIRYFLAAPTLDEEAIRSTTVKDLATGLAGTPTDVLEFLHKYMTLTRCDLFFADKAVLIEGPTERLLLPSMIAKVDTSDPSAPQLSNQYVSVVEVGGAYAHIFFPLVDFLELRTLIITDIDTVNSADAGKACVVAEGTGTSNKCLSEWAGDSNVAPASLIAMSRDAKVQGMRRIAYQIPELDGGPCPRSFEDAFSLANQALFGLDAVPPSEKAKVAWERAKALNKTDFALNHAIRQTDWGVPRYIEEGLVWLRGASAQSGAAVTAEIAQYKISEPGALTDAADA